MGPMRMTTGTKRKRMGTSAVSMRPITAFFERKRMPPLSEPARMPADGVPSRDDDDNDTESISDAGSTDERAADHADRATVALPAIIHPRDPVTLNQTHLTRLVHRRELGQRAHRRTDGRRRCPQQRLLRWALTQLETLPLQLTLPVEAEQQIRMSHRLVSTNDEFFASCLAFDGQGVVLAAGSSNGVIALFDFDEVFHRSLNLSQDTETVKKQQQRQVPDSDGGIASSATPISRSASPQEVTDTHPVVKPLHMIFTGLEVQCIRWNPWNEVPHNCRFLLVTRYVSTLDEIACSFFNSNQIHLYNLRKLPSKPYQILRASSRPSSGYMDFVFLPPAVEASSNKGRRGAVTPVASSKNKAQRVGRVVAGDMDGTLRMWDLRFPTRVQWTVSTGSVPVSSMVLARDHQHLVCGTEAGVIVNFDVYKLVVPAFGSRAMPPRRATFRVSDLIRPYLSTEMAGGLAQAMEAGASVLGVTSIHLAAGATTQIVCQLRNQWVTVMDMHTGAITGLYTRAANTDSLIPRLPAGTPASVLHTASQDFPTRRSARSSSVRHSWLHQHRCVAAPVFHGDMLCSGIPDDSAISIIDLQQLDHLRPRDSSPPATMATTKANVNGVSTDQYEHTVDAPPPPRQDLVNRFARFRLPLVDHVTAVAAHPSLPWIVCGGADLRLRILGVTGDMDVDIQDTTEGMPDRNTASD